MGGSDIDDPPQRLSLHFRHHGPDQVEGGREVDGRDGVPLLFRKIFHRGDMLDAGVVDDDVDLAEFGPGGVGHGADGFRLAHAGAGIGDFDAGFPSQGEAQGFRSGLASPEAVEHDIGALGGQGSGDAEADAAGGAGDDGGFSFEHDISPLGLGLG